LLAFACLRQAKLLEDDRTRTRDTMSIITIIAIAFAGLLILDLIDG
jgi:hypothetical protein